MKAIRSETVNSCWRKLSRHCAWLHRIYNTDNQGHHETLWIRQKKVWGWRVSRYGSRRNSRTNRHRTRVINRRLDGGEYFWPSAKWGRRYRRKLIDLIQSDIRVPIIQDCFGLLVQHGPSMIQGLKLKRTMEEGLVPYRNIFREIKKQKAEITMCFYKVTLSMPASPASPSISPTSLASAISEKARPSPPLLPLPPPPSIQHEDNKAEDFYDDDPLPLHEE